jgi:hypothetical protein
MSLNLYEFILFRSISFIFLQSKKIKEIERNKMNSHKLRKKPIFFV